MINEAMHVPDIDNVEVLINNIINKIEDIILIHVYSSTPKNSKPAEKQIDDQFLIKEIDNPCSWFGDGNVIQFHFTIDEIDPISAKFGEYRKGTGFIIDGDKDNGLLPTIDGCSISIWFSANNSIFNWDIEKDKIALENRMFELRSKIMHELTHAYNEMFEHNYIPVIPEKDETKEEYVEPSDFMSAYYAITDILNFKKYKNEKEKLFLYLMYTCCYIEREAHIAQFYQELYDEESLNPIDDYELYKKYEYNLKFIEQLKTSPEFEFLFKDYKDIASGLFGKAAKKQIYFIKRVKESCTKALSNMKSIYMELYLNGRIRSRDERIADANEAKDIYYNDKRDVFYPKTGIDPEDKINEAMSREYVYTETEQNANLVRHYFGKTINH